MLGQSLDNMVADGVNWVALNVFWFQDDLTSTAIAPRYDLWSTPEASVERAVEEIHSRGMSVLLKPMLDVASGQWRGEIPPSDPWFTAYQGFIGEWAQKATDLGVEALCVGTELKATVGEDAKWRDVIQEARSKFSGPLTYGANWDNFAAVTWWDALDSIGIDAYFPLTGVEDPSIAELMAAWDLRADGIEGWLTGLPPAAQKPVLFTEIGYRSLNGANMAPWAWEPYGTANVDLQEQAECYFAALRETWNRDWMDGYFWWIWETNPMAGIDPGTGLPMNDYTPQNKPAEGVFAYYYRIPEPTGLVLLGGALAALARRRRRRSPRQLV